LSKKKPEKPQHILTPRQISRWERQKKRQRIIMASGIFVIVLALAVAGIGWYLGQFKPMRETVIKVNGTEFAMDYYVEMLKLEGAYHSVSDLSYVADSALQNIQRYELLRQGALELGFSIADEDVVKELRENDLPDKEVYRDLIRQQLLTDRLLSAHFDSQVPLFAEQRQVTAMMLESESQALDIRSRLEDGEDFGELAEELSLEPVSRSRGGDLGWVPRVILQEMLQTSIVDDIFSQRVGELSQPIYDDEAQKWVGYWLVRVLDRDEEEEETHIQVMLLSNEEEAQDIKRQLEAGEEWGPLAVEHSQMQGAASDEGEYLVSPGEMSGLVDEYAHAAETEPGVISEPLRDETTTTKGGYWLIEIPAQDADRRISTEYRDYLKTKAFDEWMAALLDDEGNEIINSLDAEKKSWAIEQAARG
jgi:parvulin-like peptidyl-prolyl isomerase